MDEKHGELLHEDLLVEILSRLPGKALMRFKCVSRRWFSLITDPIFAGFHNTRSYSREGGGIFVAPTSQSNDCLVCIIDINKEAPERVSVFEPSISYQCDRHTNIVNGLICYYHHTSRRSLIHLYNITTRQVVSLPLTQVEVENRLDLGFERRCLLGYDPVSNEYKVLHFYRHEREPIKCQVFTLGCPRKMWRPLDVSHIPLLDSPCWNAFCVDGFLYWTEQNVMILFSVGLEIFKSVSLPEDIETSWLRRKLVLVKVDGCLSLVSLSEEFHSFYQIIRWRFKEDEDSGESEWIKEVVACEDRTLRAGLINHLGQMFSAHSPSSDCSIIDYYDRVTGKHLLFQANNPRGILHRLCPRRRPYWTATRVIDNIMPLHLLSNS